MSVRVIYSGEALLHRTGGQPGGQIERCFNSVDAAMKASLPEGCVFAFIPVENGRHVYSARFGWEFSR